MKQGFEIIEKNHLKPWGEVDVIATKDKRLYFFEIKSVSCEIEQNKVSRETVTHETLGRRTNTGEAIRPEENAHLSKLRRFSRVIQTYLKENRVSRETPYQADLITVRFDTKTKRAIVERFEKIL